MGRNFGHNNRGRGGFRPSQGRGRGDYGRGGFSSHGESRGRGRNEKGFHGNRGRGHSPPRRPANYREEEHMRDRNLSREREDLRAQRSENRFEEGYRVSVQQGRGTSPHRFDRRGASHTQHRGGGDKARGARPVQDEIDVQSDLLYGDEGVDITPTKWGKSSRSPSREMDMFREKSATPSRSPQRQDRAQSQDSSFGSKPVLERLGGFVEEPQRPAFPDQSIRITVGNDICLKQGRGQATSRLGPPVDAVSPSPERRFRRSESSSPPDKRRRSRSRSYSPEGERWRHSRSRSYSTQRSQSRGRSRSRSPSYRRSRSRSHSRGRSYHRRRRSCSTDSERSIDRYDKRRSHMDREHKKRKPERRGSGQRRTHSGSSERHQSENRGSLEKDRSKRESFIRNSRGLVSTKPHVLDLLENIAHGIPVSSSEADKNVEQINLNKTAAASAGVENDVIHRSITVKPENQQDYRSPLLETPSPVPSNPPEIKVKSILKNSGRDNSVHNQTNQSMFHTQNQDLYSDPLPGFNTGEKSGLGHEFLSSYSAKNTEYMKSQSDALGKAEDLQSHKASGAGYTDNPPPDGPSRPGAPLIPGLGDINVEDEDEFLYGDLDQQPAESESSQPVETHMIPPEEAKVEKPHEAKDTESNPLLENVLKSIGFNFELSKIMQEKAQKDRVASAPRKDPPPDPFGINQAASFLGRGGLTHVDFGSVFDPGSVQGKLQPAGQQVQQKGTKRKILESVSAESYEQKAKRYLEEQAKRYISGESEFEHKETHSQHGALADVGRYSARRLPDVDPFSLSPKGNESHMVSSDPYQERPMSNAPYNDPYQERTGDSVPHDDPYIGQTEFGQNKRDKIPRSDSYEKRYQHVTERHSPISDEMSAGRRSRLSESSSAGWDRPSSRDSCNERSLETQQFGKRLDSSYRSPSPPHTDYRRYQGSTEHYQDRQTRTDKLQSDPNAVTKQKSRQGDPDKNTTRHIFPICDSADGKEYRQYDRDKSKTRPLSREIYKMSPKEIRSPREDLYRQSPREETYRLSSREEEVYKQSPKDEPYKQSHREEVYKQSPREEIYKQSSRTDMFKQSPREELYKHSPREEVSKQSPQEELYKQSPREDLYKQSARMMYKQTKQPQKDAYRQSPKEMYKQSPRDQWDEEPAQSATKPSRSFRHSDKVMGERGAQKKKYTKNERPSDRDRVDDISYRDKEWHGRQSWERSPEKEEQFQEVKEKITRPLVKIEFKGTTQPPQKKTKRSGEHLEEEHDIHEQRIVKNLTSERSRQMEISETRASRSPRDSMPAVKMKPIGSPSNTSRGFIDSPQVKGDLQVKELYKQSISSNQESRRTVVPPSRESKKSEPKETRNVSIIIRKPLNLPKPSTFYDSDSDDLLSEVEKARLLHESKERQNRLASLEKELAILKRQQNELMRKRQRQKYGHRDPVLMQNNRLQEKVASQISKLRKEAEGKERELLKKFSVPAKKQVSPKGTSDDKSPIHKMKEMKKGTFDKVSKDKPPKEEKKNQPLQVDPKGSDSKPEEKKDNKAVLEVEKTGDKKAEKKSKKMEIQYQCYDQGNHWCPSCNVLSSTLYNLFEHLHGKKHVQNMDQYDRPWMPDSLKQSKKSAETKGMKALVCPFKGTEFMMPIKGFYCKLCKEFSGDETCGVEHLKSKTHNENYAKYIEDNLFYEERLNLDRAAGMAVRRSEEEKEKAETKEEKAAQKKKLQTEKTEKARQRNLELIKKEQIESENIEDLGDCAIPEPVTLGTASHSSQTQGQDKQGDGTREVSKLGRKSISIKLSGPSKVTIGKNALQIGNKGKKDIRPVSKPVEIMPMKRFRKLKPLGAEKIDEIKAEEDPMETGSVDSFFTIGKGNDSIALPVMQDAVKKETNLQKVSEKGAKDPENSASFSSVTDPKVDTKIDYLSSEPPAPGTCEDKRSSADKTERTAEKETAEVQSLNQIDLSQVPLPPGPCLAASNSKPTTNMATTSAGNLYSVFFSNSMKDSASEPILPKSTTDNLKVSVPELSVPELPPPRTSDIAVMETRSSDDEDKTETGNKMAFENISVQESKVVQQQDSKITGADTCELSASQSCQNKSSTSDGEISVQEKSAGVQQIHIGNIKSGQSVEILKECVDIPLPEPILHSASNEQHAMQNTKIIKQQLTFDSCTQSAGCAAADKEIAPGHESSETVSCKENCDSHCSKTTAVVTASELQIQQLHSEITPSLTAETLFLDSSTNTAVSCSLTTQEPVEMDVEGGSNIEESCSLTTPVPAHEPGEMDIEDTQMIEGQTFTSSSVSKDTNDKESSVSNECSFGNNTNPQHAISAVDSSQQTASPAEEGSTPGETSVKQSPSHESNSISIDFTFKDLPEEKANSGLDSEKDIVTENPSKPETCSVIEGQRIELQICAPEAISISKTNIHELAREGECKTPQQSIGSVGAVFDNLVQGTCSGEEGNCLTVQNPEKTTESEEPPTEVTCSASGFPSQTLVQEVSSVSENSPVSKPGSGSKNENINSASEDLVSQPEIKSLSLEPSSNSARDIESVKVPAHERSRISERDSVRKELSDKAPPIVLKDHSTIKAPEPGPASYCGDCSVTVASENESSIVSGESSVIQTNAEGPNDQAQDEQCSVNASQSDTYKAAIGQIVKNLTSEVAEYETAQSQKETASFPENTPADLAQSATDQIGVQSESKLVSESEAAAADLSQEPLSQFEDPGFGSAPLTNEDSLDQITEKQVSEVLGLLSSLDEAAVDSGYIAACSAGTSVTEQQNTGQEPQQGEGERSTSDRSDPIQNPAIVATELPEQIFQPDTTVEMAIGRDIIDDQQESRMA